MNMVIKSNILQCNICNSLTIFDCLGNAEMLPHPLKTFEETNQGVFLESKEATSIIKSQIEKINSLVSDIQAKVDYEIKSKDISSIDISFQNILTDPDEFDAKIDKSLTTSATNASLHTMAQAIKKIQEIIYEANMTLIQKDKIKTMT